MSESPLPALDPLLHQPVRTQIVAFLSGRGEATFNELKRVLEITDGNLGAHLTKLTDAGLIKARETIGTTRTQSTFSLTQKGRTALTVYVRRLEHIMRFSSNEEKPSSRNLFPKST
jgi:predicted ArsR family transcriptional regulator